MWLLWMCALYACMRRSLCIIFFCNVRWHTRCDEMWTAFLNLLGAQWVMPNTVLELFLAWRFGIGSKIRRIMWRWSFMAVIWSLWKERNTRCFDSNVPRSSWWWKGPSFLWLLEFQFSQFSRAFLRISSFLGGESWLLRKGSSFLGCFVCSWLLFGL